MKYLLVFLLLLCKERSFAQADTIFIKGIKFVTVKQPLKTEYRFRDTVLKIYRIKEGKRVFVLSYYLFRYGADCNNEFRDIGSVEVKDDLLLLKTKYQQKTGLDPLPKSSLKIYRMKEDGRLILISDQIKN